MTRGELCDEIGMLAQNCRHEYPAVALVLYALGGSIVAGSEIVLATLAGEFSKAELERLRPYEDAIQGAEQLLSQHPPGEEE